MKAPLWNDAPSWARYLTQDRDGTFYWWEERPLRLTACWYSVGGMSQVAVLPEWKEQIEERR